MAPPTLLGIEIGGTKLQIVRGTSAGDITERHRFQVDRERGAEGIREQIATALPELTKNASAVGIGFVSNAWPESGMAVTVTVVP